MKLHNTDQIHYMVNRTKRKWHYQNHHLPLVSHKTWLLYPPGKCLPCTIQSPLRLYVPYKDSRHRQNLAYRPPIHNLRKTEESFV